VKCLTVVGSFILLYETKRPRVVSCHVVVLAVLVVLGQVTKESFKAILRQAYGSDNSTMASSIFKMFDTDGSGYPHYRPLCVSVAGTLGQLLTHAPHTRHTHAHALHYTINDIRTQIDRFPRVCDGVELHALGPRGGRS
jgi:hypothetical protein